MSDLVKIQDAVREDVKQSILKVLPSEVVDKVVSDIFEKEVKSQIEALFKETYRQNLRNKVCQIINSKYSDMVEEDIEKLSKSVGENFMRGFADSMVQEAVYKIQNSY